MSVFLFSLLIFSGVQLAPLQTSRVHAWGGTYEYSESAPPDIVMDYVIKIAADGSIRVAVDGHMTTIHLFATARTEGDDKLGIFYERGGDYESPQLGLKRGDRLVTLRKKSGKYFLRWGGLTSQFDQTPPEVAIEKRK